MKIFLDSKVKLSGYCNSHSKPRRNSQASASTKLQRLKELKELTELKKVKEFEAWLNGETWNGESGRNANSRDASSIGTNGGINGYINGAIKNDDPVYQSDRTIERHFTKGACYQVIKNKKIINRLKNGGKYVIQEINESSNDPECGYIFRYLGKVGIHHTFAEICGNWTRTYTDAQLVGKELIEVSGKEIISGYGRKRCQQKQSRHNQMPAENV